MNALIFLMAFLVLTLLGGFLLWMRDRGPRSMDAHIRAFHRELNALSPETPIMPPPRRHRAEPRRRPRGPGPG